MSNRAFYVRMNKDSRLKEAVDIGDVQDYQECQSVMRTKGLEGKFPYMAGYMRLRHGITLTDSGSSGGGNVIINVVLPFGGDALSLDKESQDTAPGDVIEHGEYA